MGNERLKATCKKILRCVFKRLNIIRICTKFKEIWKTLGKEQVNKVTCNAHLTVYLNKNLGDPPFGIQLSDAFLHIMPTNTASTTKKLSDITSHLSHANEFKLKSLVYLLPHVKHETCMQIIGHIYLIHLCTKHIKYSYRYIMSSAMMNNIFSTFFNSSNTGFTSHKS
jgi:hypothetical protein